MSDDIKIQIDDMLDQLASSVYDVQNGTLDPLKLAGAVIDKLGLCDIEAVQYARMQAQLWHNILEIGCQLEGRQSLKVN